MPQDHQKVKGMYDGPILPLIIRLAMPIFLGGIFQLVYNITDTLWVGWIDKNDETYIAATGLLFPIIMFAIAFSNGLSIGISSLVARAIGEKNFKILSKAAESGIFIAAIISLILLISCYWFIDPILHRLGAKGTLFIRSKDYFLYLIPCCAFIFFSSVFSGILQGEGKMMPLMYSMIIGTISNIILDPIFIFTLGMGIKGAALATTIAQGLGMIYLLAVFLMNLSSVRIEWKLKNIQLKIITQIFKVGFPSTLSHLFMSVYFVFFNHLIIAISESAFTAFTLYARIEGIVMIPLFGVSSAMVTMIGQNGGRQLFSRVKGIWYHAIIIGLVTTGGLGLFFWLLSPFIYPIFNSVPQVLDYSNQITWILLLALFIGNVGITAPAIYEGIGHTRPSVIISFFRLFVFIVPIVYTISYFYPKNLFAICIGLLFAEILTSIMVYLWAGISLHRLETGKLKVLQTLT